MKLHIENFGTILGLLIFSSIMLMFCGNASAAQNAYLTLKIDGEVIQGESGISTLNRKDTIECHSYAHEVSKKKSQGSMLEGKPIFGHVKITKNIDKSTPFLLEAWDRNKQIDEAVFRFYRPNARLRSEELYYTIIFTKASIVRIQQISEGKSVGGSPDLPMREEIELTAEEITWTYESTSATHTATISPQQ
ncbi:MAG: type VI secretion system tube protein Hcp [Candidatus Thiodiazotropha sp.]